MTNLEKIIQEVDISLIAMYLHDTKGCPDKNYPAYTKIDKRYVAPDDDDDFTEDKTYSCVECWTVWLNEDAQ